MSETTAPSDSVRSFMTDLDNNEIEDAATYLADSFAFSGWTPRILDKAGFLSMIRSIKEGIPGLSFNLHNVSEQSPTAVTGAIQVSGYQVDSFVVSVLGAPPIPQMASSVSLPAENVTYQIERGLITAMDVQHVEGGGIQGLFRQLGTDVILP